MHRAIPAFLVFTSLAHVAGAKERVIVMPEVVIVSAPCVTRALLTGGTVRVCPGGVL